MRYVPCTHRSHGTALKNLNKTDPTQYESIKKKIAQKPYLTSDDLRN